MKTRGIHYWRSLSKEDIQRLINGFRTKTEMAKAIGMSGGWLKEFSAVVLSEEFDTSCWKTHKDTAGENHWTYGKKGSLSTPNRVQAGEKLRLKAADKFLKELAPRLFIKDCKLPPAQARAAIRQYNKTFKWLPELCATPECTVGTSWLGKKLTLHIDHINGDPADNRLENLRFLCPNCHTQTETYSWRNTRRNKKMDPQAGSAPAFPGPEPSVLLLDD